MAALDERTASKLGRQNSISGMQANIVPILFRLFDDRRKFYVPNAESSKLVCCIQVFRIELECRLIGLHRFLRVALSLMEVPGLQVGVGEVVRLQGKRHCISMCRGVQLIARFESVTIASPIFSRPVTPCQVPPIATSFALPVTAITRSVFLGAQWYIPHNTLINLGCGSRCQQP